MSADNLPTTPHSILGRMLQRAPTDDAAWGEFVHRYGPVIHRWCRERRVPETDSLDLAQQVLGRLHNSLHHYDRSKGRFRHYLGTITQNVVKDYFSSQNRDLLTNAVTVDLIPEQAQPKTLAERLAEEYDLELLEEARQRVRQRCCPQHWAVFCMTVDDGRDAKDVAKTLGMGLSTVYRARAEIMTDIEEELKRLEEYGFDGG